MGNDDDSDGATGDKVNNTIAMARQVTKSTMMAAA